MTNVLPKATAHVDLDDDPDFRVNLCSLYACVRRSLYVENDDFSNVVLLDNPPDSEGVVTAEDSNSVLEFAKDVLATTFTFLRNPVPADQNDVYTVVVMWVDEFQDVKDLLEENTINRYQIQFGWSYSLNQVGFEASYPENGVFVSDGCGGATEPTLEEIEFGFTFSPNDRSVVVTSSQPELDFGEGDPFENADPIAPNGYKMVIFVDDPVEPNAPHGFTLRRVVVE